MRGGLDPGSSPAELEGKKLVALHQLLHEAKFRDPSGEHLSPAGREWTPPSLNVSSVQQKTAPLCAGHHAPGCNAVGAMQWHEISFKTMPPALCIAALIMPTAAV